MAPLHPDIITSHVLEQLAYEGASGVPFERLWELLPAGNEVTPLYKSIVYSWIRTNENLELTSQNSIIDVPATIDEVPSDALIKITEDYQWLVLTGSPKENNSIGNAAFQLLTEIAKQRESGVDSLTLIKTTGQDNRSLTSRIKVISHLIKKFTILKKGRTLSLFIFNKFYKEDILNDFTISNGTSKEVTINLVDLREKITNTLKAAKSGIRQMNDLRRELEMDKSPRLKVAFKSTISYLQFKGCIAKLLVVSSVSQTKKIRSVKYLKDYVKADSATVEDDNDDEEFFNSNLIDDVLKDLDDEDDEQSSSIINNNAAKIEIVDASTTSTHTPSLNRFYPLQNQLYEKIQAHGQTGCSSNYIIDEFFGVEYSRLFTKLIESFTSGKLLPHIADLGIIRHYDFNGRVKFYRYITRPNLLALTHQPEDPNGFVLPPFKVKSRETFSQLNKKNFVSLGAKIDTYLDDHGVQRVLWRGDGIQVANVIKEEDDDIHELDDITPQKKRGRPKKGEVRPKKDVKKSKRSQDIDEQTDQTADEIQQIRQIQQIIDQTERQQQEGSSSVKEEHIDEKPQLIISEIKGTSFKAIERQAAILRLLEDSDGVREDNINFLNDVRDELGYIVDKKTFRKDIASLISQDKLFIEEIQEDVEANDDEDEGYQEDADVKIIKVTSLLISVNANIDAIENLKRTIRERQTKKNSAFSKKLEEVNLEIDFFDTELRDSFNNPKIPIIKPQAEKKPPKNKQPRQIKPKKTTSKTSHKAEVKQKYTARVEASEPFDPNTSTTDELFENVRTKVRPNFKKLKEPKVSNVTAPHGRKRRNGLNLTSRETLILFKAVIICKTINENRIIWSKISELLGIDSTILRTKWPRIRMMMGTTGIKVAKRNWKKILLNSVRGGEIEMNQIENLELHELVALWEDHDSMNVNSEGDFNGAIAELNDENKLFINPEDNDKHYKFVKLNDEDENIKNHYDSNSMIQREQFLINTVFTYSGKAEDKSEDSNVYEDGGAVDDLEKIRNIIIAIVASGTNLEVKKLQVLEEFDKDVVNKVFLKLIKSRQIVISHQNQEDGKPPISKVLLGEKISTILDDSTFDFKLPKVSKFQNLLKEMLEAQKGLILNPLFDNSYLVPILELAKDKALDLTRVDHYRKEVLSGYEARTLEREKLDSDIILTSLNNQLIKSSPETLKVPIPRGKPCSHIWIDITGSINAELWEKLLKIIVSTLISKPGIVFTGLSKILSPVLSKSDLKSILRWLQENGAVHQGEFDGYWLQSQWYMSLGF
jgi:transcription factor C subunit 3